MYQKKKDLVLNYVYNLMIHDKIVVRFSVLYQGTMRKSE